MQNQPDTRRLLTAALANDWIDLALETGISSPRLVQLSLIAIDDPKIIAKYPIECRILADRRDRARAARSAAHLGIRIET